MHFQKIVTVDDCGLTSPEKDGMAALSESPLAESKTDPANDAEIIARIGDADCVLVSWRTKINAAVIAACPSIKYIGMCCSLYDEKSANVDIPAARERGIVVKGVRDYGDEGTVEFIFSQLIGLYKGMYGRQWGAEPSELTSKTMGIVGMGTVGKMVARAALHFGMRVVYFSRTRKEEMEDAGVEFMPLEAMLPLCDVVSLHLPRNTELIGEREFHLMRRGAVFINTSLGRPFDTAAFFAWLEKDADSYGLFDGSGAEGIVASGASHPNVIFYPNASGFTAEAKKRLTRKALGNMRDFLAGR